MRGHHTTAEMGRFFEVHEIACPLLEAIDRAHDVPTPLDQCFDDGAVDVRVGVDGESPHYSAVRRARYSALRRSCSASASSSLAKAASISSRFS